jgi:hypothetical protein
MHHASHGWQLALVRQGTIADWRIREMQRARVAEQVRPRTRQRLQFWPGGAGGDTGGAVVGAVDGAVDSLVGCVTKEPCST